MSTHSAIFGPTKYGMLPELLPEKKLSWGNGVFGLGTFAAIITGTISAGTLSDLFKSRRIYSGAILIVLAFLDCRSVSFSGASADPTQKKNFAPIFLATFFHA